MIYSCLWRSKSCCRRAVLRHTKDSLLSEMRIALLQKWFRAHAVLCHAEDKYARIESTGRVKRKVPNNYDKVGRNFCGAWSLFYVISEVRLVVSIHCT